MSFSRLFSISFSLFSVYLLSTHQIFSQENFTVTGRVISADDSLPIPGAHIRVGAEHRGTVTNSDGVFKLFFTETHLHERLIVSSLGYKTLEFPITSAVTSKELEIILPQSELTLPKTIVEADEFTAFNLVRKAISKIPENYDPKPVTVTAFYREYLRVFAKELNRTFSNPKKAKRKKDRVLDKSLAYNVTEGVFQFYKYPYFGNLGKKDDLAKLIKGRRIDFEPRSVQDSVVQSLTNRFRHKGGPHDMLKHDILKDPDEMDFMKKKAYKKYEFRTLGIVEYETRGAFKVVFDQKKEIKDGLYKGEIYIDTATYAIMQIDFSLSPRGIEYQSLGLPLGIVSFLTGVEMELLDFHGKLTYAEYRGKWYPEYHQYGGILNVKMERDSRRRELKVNLILRMQGDLLITHIDRTHVREFDKKELFKENDALDDFVGEYNDVFWEKHNYVLPSEEMIREMKLEEKNGKH